MRHFLRFCVCLSMLMLALSGARAQPDLPPDPVIGHLQKARFGASAVVVDGQIYVLGGAAKNEVTSSVERIDPASGGVTLLTPKLRPRFFATAESYGPFIFIFGGQDETGALTTVVERLDTRDNSVARLAPLPAGRRILSSAIVGDKIYLAGGASDVGERRADLWIYSIPDDKWSEGAPMLLAKETDLLARGDTLYAIAGFDGEAATDDFEAYDIATNQWRALAPLPFKMSAHHGAIVGDKLWTFGDYAQLGRVSAYDFASGQWRLLENTGYIPRRHTTVVAANGLVWSLGGNTTSSAASSLDAVQRFDPALEAVVPWP